MKHRDDEWDHGPQDGYETHSGCMMPVEEEQAPEGEPVTFSTIRRIEYISRLHHMAFRSVLHEDDLPPAQVGAVKEIIRHPGMSQRELADRLHIQRATVTVMLQKMERAGFIVRQPDPEDQRIFRIFPTPAAIAQEEENRKTVDHYFAKCFQGFSETEFDALNTALSKLGANIREVLAERPEPPKKE